nr:MAG: DNA replication protein DnaC [Chloroflexota bacterium]
MGDDTSPANTPISSSTEPDDTDQQPCPLCGLPSLCGGMGVVRYDLPVGDPNFGKLFRCPNYRVNLDNERQEKLRKLSNLSNLSDKVFDTFQTDLPMWTPAQQQSLRTALKIAMAYAENPDGWLLLEGTYGCGKTHLAAAVGNARLEMGDTVLFITSPDLLDHLRGTYGPSSEIGYDEMFDRVRNAPLLILDDLGVENPSHWAQEKMFQLLNYRYSRRMPTVITTNADLDMLDPRVRSRLLDESMIHRVRITAPDFRTPVQSQRDRLSNLTLYSDMTFDNFDVSTNAVPEDRQNLERALAVARSYAQSPQDWLVFMGAYGSGKTHLAAAIANELQQRGTEVVFVTVPDLLDYLRMTYNPGTTTTFEGRFQAVRNASVLFLDDLGTESATPWAKEKLFQIINHRYVARLPTVMTTAKPVEELDARIRSRLLDRRRCMVFAITAPAYVSRLYRK